MGNPSDPPRHQEIDLNELLQVPTKKPLIYNPSLEFLPINLLNWATFEKLCVRLLTNLNRGKLTQAFRYGETGHKQFGIDILALKIASNKQLLMQCKHIKKLKRGDIKNYIDKFLEEKKNQDSDEFILGVACDFEHDPQLVEEWAAAKRQLSEKGIFSEIWGFNQINDFLRLEPEIVKQFFGEEYVSSFCSEVPSTEKYPEKYRSQFLHRDANYVVIENETIRFDLFVPSEQSAKVTATISFARSDLSGITLSLPGKTVVEWMQWAGHTSNFGDAPYVMKAAWHEDRYVFVAPEARLMLDSSELTHLHWIFQTAWNEYIQAALELERKWRFLRFKALVDKRKKIFGLMRISRPLWKVILEFCQDHESSKGSGVMHVFEYASMEIKVYVGAKTEHLDRGYHLTMYAYQDGGATSKNEDKLTLGWTPLMSISDMPEPLHPRKAWDAEFTHDWLTKTLIPAVEEWINAKEKQQWKKNTFFLKRILGKPPERIHLRSHFYSLSDLPARQMSNHGMDLPRVIENIHKLQSHFHIYYRKAEIEPKHIITVIQACARLAPLITLESDRYIRGNLNLGDEDLVVELEKLVAADPKKFGTPAWMDYALRSLLDILENTSSFPESELAALSESFSPAWDRMREDLICEVLH